MPLDFRIATSLQPGHLYDMLSRSYDPLLTLATPEQAQHYIAAWQAFDDAVFKFPDTIGACVRVSYLEDGTIPIGLFSWDTRGCPAEDIVGQNCVLPGFRNRGYGKQQISEVLRLLRLSGCKRAVVETGADDFFRSARQMYMQLGFTERIQKQTANGDLIIEYQLDLEPK